MLSCFFASGMSGLIYQVIWVRELVLVFGATTFAVSTVLTAFMGGLALGSFYFGRRSKKIARPLRLYGLLELGIGLYGLAIPLIFAALPGIYRIFWQQLSVSFFALSVARFLFTILALIAPTAMMGATLPVLASYYARDVTRIGLRVGSLYSLNTFGAVMGAAATGFLFIRLFGMRATTALAASINIALAAVALALARSNDSAPAASEQAIAPLVESHLDELHLKEKKAELAAKKSRRAPALSRRAAITVIVGFALSGFVALSYEVIWSRVLALIIGSSVYAFSIMLTTFLVGLALGASFASRFVDRIRRPVIAFALIEVGVGLTSMAGACLFDDLPYIFVQVYKWFDDSATGLLLFARFLIASLVMIAPTLLLGALFPLVVKIVSGGARESSNAGQMAGDVYAANTVGAIAGSFASGFLLIPWLGLLDSLRVCAALNFVVSAALFFVHWKDSAHSESADVKREKTSRQSSQQSARGRRRASSRRIMSGALAPAGVAISAALIALVVVFEPPWDSEVMSSAVYRYAPSLSQMSRQQFSDYLKRGQGETIFYKEGITATVAVQRLGDGRVLKVNGKPEASTAGDMPTQVLIGSLPLLVRERTDEALVIGLGSGITLGSIEQFPIRRVTCVELEPAVVEASHQFDDVNNRPLEDARLRLIANDGRNFIFTTSEKFDVIVSEPSNPWLTGVANLFTLEYFKRGADRLTDDGVFSQWLQIYEMSPEDVKTLVATFRAAFPHVYIFRGAEGDLMLLGSKRERALDLSIIKSHLADAKIASDLNRVEIASAADLLSRFYLSTKESNEFASGAPINTDDNALIEFNAPRRVGARDETIERNAKELLAHAASPLPHISGHATDGPVLFVEDLPSNPRGEADFLLDLANGAIKRGDKGRAEQFVGYSLELYETARAHSLLGEIRFSQGDEQAALDRWHRALEMDANHYYTLIDLGKLYLTKQDIARAAPYLDRALQIDPGSARAHHLRGLAYQATGDNARAAMEYRKTLPDARYTRSIPTYYLNFGTALASLGLYEEAGQMLEEYTRLAPNDADGHYHLGAVYEILAEGSSDDSMTYRAIESLKRALSIKPGLAMAHYYLSKAYRRLGLYEQADAEFELYERLSP